MDDLSAVRRLHLVGVAGAGMSALAKLLSGRGFTVTGSDLRASEALARLADQGFEVWSGHDPARIRGSDLVVASSAVPDNDPELRAATEVGIPVWRRPQLLASITGMIPTIGPTGTHGKTASTAMMVTAARAAGLDPSFVIGGELLDLRTNAVVGRDDLLILEVDEAFGTFEHVELRGLLVTNVEADHLDHFGTFEEIEAAFGRVVAAVDGPVLACVDDPGAAKLAERAGTSTYGTARSARWRIDRLESSPSAVSFRLSGPGITLPVTVPVPGAHVARNAAGVLALLSEYGVDPEPAARGLEGFRGVRRRFERRGTVDGITLVDDYAHHPTEVRATLEAALQAGHRRVWAVFQPHLYSRTELMHAEFGEALARADRVIVTDVFGARETPRPGITGEMVATAAARAGAQSVEYVPHRADVAAHLADRLLPGDLVVTLGAGDITVVATELLGLLAARGER